MTTDRVIPPDERQKPAIARELLAHADRRGWVSVDPPKIAAALGLPVHDVAHALWDFQKKGMMKFRETKSPARTGTTQLTALRLTTEGRSAMTAMTTAAAVLMASHASPPPAPAAPEPVEEEFVPLTTDDLIEEGSREARATVGEFPLVAALLRRKDDLEEAASLLERAGQVDMALSAMDRANADDLYTPLEAEHVRLWARVLGR